jgi:hypothetical protein
MLIPLEAELESLHASAAGFLRPQGQVPGARCQVPDQDSGFGIQELQEQVSGMKLTGQMRALRVECGSLPEFVLLLFDLALAF